MAEYLSKQVKIIIEKCSIFEDIAKSLNNPKLDKKKKQAIYKGMDSIIDKNYDFLNDIDNLTNSNFFFI